MVYFIYYNPGGGYFLLLLPRVLLLQLVESWSLEGVVVAGLLPEVCLGVELSFEDLFVL